MDEDDRALINISREVGVTDFLFGWVGNTQLPFLPRELELNLMLPLD